MQNLNPYNQEVFEKNFRQTATFASLDQLYDNIFFDKFFESIYPHLHWTTPRQQEISTKVSAVPFYYLQYLDQSVQIVDLGCGINFFKPYFPDLIGVGAETGKDFFGDIYSKVDDDFYQNHVDTYYSVFSINALHFHPLEDLKKICIKFSNMLRPSGRGFLALNAQRMIERSKVFKDASIDQIDTWIRKKFDNFPTKILVFDVDLSVRNAYMDGNIRIVFEK